VARQGRNPGGPVTLVDFFLDIDQLKQKIGGA
jgi:hypothetical protein